MARPSTRGGAQQQASASASGSASPPASPLSTATYASTKGFVDLLEYLLETSKKDNEKKALNLVADLYTTRLQAEDAEESEARLWDAYVEDVWKEKKHWPKGQLRQRQGIGYAEILGPNPSAFLLVWNHGKPLDKAEWVSAEETPQEMWNELCNHFLTEAFDHALQPVSRNWPKPPIALLPGLEDMRDDMHEALVKMINERGWPIEFDEEAATPSGSQKKTAKGKRHLPWTLYELLKEVKDVPGYDDEYDRERTVLNNIYHDADGVSFFNDDFEGPIVVARARQVMPDDSDDRVWWLKLEKPTMPPENGQWYLDGDEATDGLDEGFVTDALLRYGCVTHPFPSRAVTSHVHHRSLTLLAGLEDRREKIADSLEEAIAQYAEVNDTVSVKAPKKNVRVKANTGKKPAKTPVVKKGKGKEKAKEEKPKPKAKAKPKRKGKAKSVTPEEEGEEAEEDAEEEVEEEADEDAEEEVEEDEEKKVEEGEEEKMEEDEELDNQIEDETPVDDEIPDNAEENEEEEADPSTNKRTRSRKQAPAPSTTKKRRKVAPKAAAKNGRKK